MKTVYTLALLLTVFIGAVAAGALLPAGLRDDLYREFSEKVRDIIGEPGRTEIMLLPLKIFLNNLIVLLVIYLLSPTLVGPSIFYIYQGVVTGAIMSAPSLDIELARNIENTIPGCVLGPERLVLIKTALLVPHGIFEIPAISLGLLASLKTSRLLVDLVRRRLGRRDIVIEPRRSLIDSLKLLLIGTVLLVIAAFVESFITPLVGGLVILLVCSYS